MRRTFRNIYIRSRCYDEFEDYLKNNNPNGILCQKPLNDHICKNLKNILIEHDGK